MRKYNGKPGKQSAFSPGRHWGNQESYKKDEKRKKLKNKTTNEWQRIRETSCPSWKPTSKALRARQENLRKFKGNLEKLLKIRQPSITHLKACECIV